LLRQSIQESDAVGGEGYIKNWNRTLLT
jgi:hypothetical protein